MQGSFAASASNTVNDGSGQMGAAFYGSTQMAGFMGDTAPDLASQGGAIIHYPDPASGDIISMRLDEYAAIGNNHSYNDDGSSVWRGPWVEQTCRPR